MPVLLSRLSGMVQMGADECQSQPDESDQKKRCGYTVQQQQIGRYHADPCGDG